MPLELTLCPTREINRLTGTDLSGVDLFGAWEYQWKKRAPAVHTT
jgi:hypothetical protein